MKLFRFHSDSCNFVEVQRASTHPSISLIVLLLATILILPSFASAEIKKEYYPSGKLKSEVNYKNGKLEGIFMDYYKHGKLKYEANYKNGKEEGIARGYYKNGKLEYEENYKNGKLEGHAKTYYETGEYMFIDTYKNGININRKSYTEDGKLEFDQDYPYLE